MFVNVICGGRDAVSTLTFQEMVYFSVENQQPYSVSFLLSHLPFPPSSFLFSSFLRVGLCLSFITLLSSSSPPLELAAGGKGERAGEPGGNEEAETGE